MAYDHLLDDCKALPGKSLRPMSTMEGQQTASILVIEDDTDMSAEIVSCLTSVGYTVQACFDGTAGLKLALSGRFDLPPRDRMLPGYNGLQLAQAVRGAGLTTPILMLSALGE